MIPSTNNLMNLKDDIEICDSFMREELHPGPFLNIPSRQHLQLIDEKDKMIETLREEIRQSRELDILQWENELVTSKDKFQSYKTQAEEEINLLKQQIEENNKNLSEKDKILTEKIEENQILQGEIQNLTAKLTETEKNLDEKSKEIEIITKKMVENNSNLDSTLLAEKEKILKIKTGEVETLKQEINKKEEEIVNLNKKIKNLNENHEKEMKSLQELCKSSVSKPSQETSFALEELKKEKNRLENLLNSNKQGFLEEKVFLEGELKRAEEQAIDAKMKYAQVSLDKEFYQMKFQQIAKEIKRRNLDIKF